MNMKYQIVQIWKRAGTENPNFFEPCFIIVGQLYGYETLDGARIDKLKLSNSDHCIIIQVFE